MRSNGHRSCGFYNYASATKLLRISAFVLCFLVLFTAGVTSAFQTTNVAVVRTTTTALSSSVLPFSCKQRMYTPCLKQPDNRPFLSQKCFSRNSMQLYSATPGAAAAAIRSVFPHADPFYCLTGILALSTFGVVLEKRTTVGKALSAPLATMALALIVANVGLLPFTSPVYNTINAYLVPLAVPLLLFDSNIRRVISDTGSLLACFGVGAVATIVGTLVAFPLVPMRGLGATNSWKVACALAARHIGGAINFVAVAETLRIPGTIVSAAIAADNVVVALYFAMLFSLAKEGEENPMRNDSSTATAAVINLDEIESEGSGIPTNSVDDKNDVNLSTLATALSVSAALVTSGKFVTNALFPGTSALPITSVLTVISATLCPDFFIKIRNAGTALGILFIQMFFAASGAAGSIALVFQQAPALFAFSALQVAIHFVVLMTLGRGVFRLSSNELYLASNANVGGPTTAAAMAQVKQWHRLVLPALLVGILGYATATGISLALGPILKRMILAK